MYAENDPAMETNETVLNDQPGELNMIEANDKIADNCKYPFALVQAAQNQEQTNTGGLLKLLKLKIGAKVMLTVNIDIQNYLANGETGIKRHIEFAQGSVRKLYIKFSYEQAGTKAMTLPYLRRQNSWVLIEKCEAEISIRKGQHRHPSSVLNFL